MRKASHDVQPTARPPVPTGRDPRTPRPHPGRRAAVARLSQCQRPPSVPIAAPTTLTSGGSVVAGLELLVSGSGFGDQLDGRRVGSALDDQPCADLLVVVIQPKAFGPSTDQRGRDATEGAEPTLDLADVVEQRAGDLGSRRSPRAWSNRFATPMLWRRSWLLNCTQSARSLGSRWSSAQISSSTLGGVGGSEVTNRALRCHGLVRTWTSVLIAPVWPSGARIGTRPTNDPG